MRLRGPRARAWRRGAGLPRRRPLALSTFGRACYATAPLRSTGPLGPTGSIASAVARGTRSPGPTRACPITGLGACGSAVRRPTGATQGGGWSSPGQRPRPSSIAGRHGVHPAGWRRMVLYGCASIRSVTLDTRQAPIDCVVAASLVAPAHDAASVIRRTRTVARETRGPDDAGRCSEAAPTGYGRSRRQRVERSQKSFYSGAGGPRPGSPPLAPRPGRRPPRGDDARGEDRPAHHGDGGAGGDGARCDARLRGGDSRGPSRQHAEPLGSRAHGRGAALGAGGDA